jgi:hypothetical protein
MIGNGAHCHVVLGEPGVADSQAFVRYGRGRYHLHALPGRLPTLLNGERIEESELHDGDQVTIGGTVLGFRQVR